MASSRAHGLGFIWKHFRLTLVRKESSNSVSRGWWIAQGLKIKLDRYEKIVAFSGMATHRGGRGTKRLRRHTWATTPHLWGFAPWKVDKKWSRFGKMATDSLEIPELECVATRDNPPWVVVNDVNSATCEGSKLSWCIIGARYGSRNKRIPLDGIETGIIDICAFTHI